MNHIAAMKHLEVPFNKGTIRAISDTTGWAGRYQGNFFEAWHTVRHSPLGDRIINTIRPWLPKKL